MWYVWIAILCLPLAVGDVTPPDVTAAAQFAAPGVALVQDQPQPPEKPGQKPKEAPKQPPGDKQLKGRVEDNRIVLEPPGEITIPTGPMRLELLKLTETRSRFTGEEPEEPPKASLRIQVKLTGERLPDLVGLGRLVVEGMIDDTGAVLVSPEDVKPSDRTATTPTRISKRLIARGFINHGATVNAPARQARKLTKVSGWVDVIYATETEDILIDNPLQYLGGPIEHPRLKELGINVRVIQPGEEVQEQRDGVGIALQFDTSRRKIRNAEFFDAWLKPMYPRSRRMETADGEPYTYYGVAGAGRSLNEDAQMLLTVYPEIEEAQIPFSFENVELP